MAGRFPQAPEPIEIGALHHPFFIDIGAEKARAIRLQPLDHFFGSEVGRLAPAFYDDAAVFGIERDDQTLWSRLRGDLFDGRRECGRADDDTVRALIQEPARSS